MESAGEGAACPPVVGVGASAGGLEAFMELLGRLPPDSGAAFVLVQHLDPHHPSRLPELLSGRTRMPVVQIDDGMTVEPNRVYVIPPNTTLDLSGGRLRLSARSEPHPSTLDLFFRSLAEELRARATAVLLSGGGTDGTLGLGAVKACGGVTIVQSPGEASFEGMPASAVAAGVADHVLPIAEIPGKVMERLGLLARGASELAADAAVERRFFRDPELCLLLSTDVLPRICGSKGEGGEIRMWVPGCATGEESYTLAILISEQLARIGKRLDVKIFATDVDEARMETARRGVYPRTIAEHVSRERLTRFFVEVPEGYAVKQRLREECIFARHDVAVDAPFRRMDLVWWRTTLSHRDMPLSAEIVPIFHYALSPGGYLALGPTESVASHPDLFRPLSERHRVFRRVEVVTRPAFSLPITAQPAPRSARRPVSRTFDQLVLETIVPPSVLIDEHQEIVYFAGKIAGYLELPAGAPSLRILDLVRSDLRMELRAVLREAIDGKRGAARRGIAVSVDGRARIIDIVVRPMSELGSVAPLFVVVFQEAEEREGGGEAAGRAPADGAVARELERELRLTKDELERSIDDLQTVNEELRAANEELQAANEDLQTSREEEQSINQELSTLNAELDRQVSMLSTANGDLQNLFEATQIATIFLDRELCIKRFTPKAAELFRLIPSDVLRPVTDIALLAAAPDIRADIAEVLASLSAREREIHRPDGDRWLARCVRPYRTVDGDVDGVVVTFVDVTDLKRCERAALVSEEMYRRLANLIPSLVWSTDRDGALTYANDRWFEYTGLTREQALGSRWSEVLHPDDRERVQLAPHLEVEVRRRNAAGEYRWFLVRAEPALDGEGKISGWFGVSTDIHGRKLAEQALMESDRRKSEFLAMLAHELRNPLAPIRNAAHLLERLGPDQPTLKQARGIIERQVVHMARMVEDLLDVSRISQGKVKLRRKTLDLVELVRLVSEDHRAVLESRGLSLEVELPSQPVPMSGDTTRLCQAIGNLLHNAGKFTRSGGHVRVSLAREAGGATARLVVEDDGMGIDPAFLPGIFEAFTQADRSLDRSLGGLGLGLSLVKGIAELHGGSVRAESEGADRGSRFTVILPVEAGAGEALEPVLCSARSVTPRRVLIVEDNEDAAESMKLLLELQGHEVSVESTGREGVAAARALKPDLVLCDIGLPGGMDGYEVAAALRGDPNLRRTHLVALTGYGSSEDQKLATESGFELHLIKPVSPDMLEQLVASLAA